MASLLSRVVLGAGIAAALIASAPANVGAQPDPKAGAPSAADKQAAKKLVDDGLAAYNTKDYDKAIELYKQAFGLIPHPILLFNIAQAHRLAGRPDKAVPFYERYLERDPSGPESGPARAALADIKAAATARSGETRPGETGEPGEPGAPPPVKRDVPPAAVEPTPAPMPAPEPDAPHRTDTVTRPGRTLRLTGLALGGAGLASAAVGLYFTTRVLHWEAEAEREGAPFTNAKSKGEAAQLRGDIAYGLAGALVIGGAVTYWLGHRKDQEARTAWAPVLGAGYAGIALSGSLP